MISDTMGIVFVLYTRSSCSLTSSLRNINDSSPEPMVRGQIHAITPLIAPPMTGRSRRPSVKEEGPKVSIFRFILRATLEKTSWQNRNRYERAEPISPASIPRAGAAPAKGVLFGLRPSEKVLYCDKCDSEDVRPRARVHNEGPRMSAPILTGSLTAMIIACNTA